MKNMIVNVTNVGAGIYGQSKRYMAKNEVNMKTYGRKTMALWEIKSLK
jgi:hypothetical protein